VKRRIWKEYKCNLDIDLDLGSDAEFGKTIGSNQGGGYLTNLRFFKDNR